MSISNAKTFVINFYSSPSLRIKIAKIKINNLNKKERLKIIISIAKKLGFNFTKKELYLALKTSFYKLTEKELKNIKGGLNINENMLNESNLKLQDFLDVF